MQASMGCGAYCKILRCPRQNPDGLQKMRENNKKKTLGAWRNGNASGFDPDM